MEQGSVTQKEKDLDGKGEKLQQKDIATKTRTKALASCISSLQIQLVF